MNPYLEIIRPNVCILAALGFFVGAMIVQVQMGPILLFAILTAFFICGAGNTINDYYDYEIDKINAPKRPLPSGRMKRENARIFSVLLYVIGAGFGFLVSPQFASLAIVNAAISYMYAARVKRMALASNIFVSWLATSVYIGAAFIESFFIGPRIAVLCVMSFTAMMAREIIKDVEDMKGDKKLGAIKLPSVIGKENAIGLSRIFSLVSIFLIPVPFMLGMLSSLYLVFTIPAIGIVLFYMVKSPSQAKRGLKLGMFLVLLGYLFGI